MTSVRMTLRDGEIVDGEFVRRTVTDTGDEHVGIRIGPFATRYVPISEIRSIVSDGLPRCPELESLCSE